MIDGVRIAITLTALLLERPLCRDCAGAKVALDDDEFNAWLATVSDVLPIQNGQEPCRACGISKPVMVLQRPPT